MGVWIEIHSDPDKSKSSDVTPCVGVWIEIVSGVGCEIVNSVTPCVGVWIEILESKQMNLPVFGHSLRGSVD